MKYLLSAITCLLITMAIKAQQEIPLYDKTIPNAKAISNAEASEVRDGKTRVSKVSVPTLTIFLPDKEKANGSAIIICPGGGYSILSISHEGYNVAKELNKAGITCFVLKYRLPSDETMNQKEIGPLQDAQRAFQLVRQKAKDWHIDVNRVGIMGFSAGGHLAATAGTHFKTAVIENKKHTNLRPDFMILGYPVISMTDSLAHAGSRNNLLGNHPSPELITKYSNELQVTSKTPPTFIVHAKDDRTVKVQNSIYFANALRKNGVPVEEYYYEKGGHGFGLVNATSNVLWIDLAIAWLEKNGWLKKK